MGPKWPLAISFVWVWQRCVLLAPGHAVRRMLGAPVMAKRPEHNRFECTTDHLEAIRTFARVARRFCAFVDATDQDTHRLRDARECLASLIAAGARLPLIEHPPDVDAADVRVPSPWSGFGECDIYWKVFDPNVDEAPIAGSLTDDFADIYLDLMRGLLAFDTGNEEGAGWEWRFHFDHHWGDHAVDALRVLQRACRP